MPSHWLEYSADWIDTRLPLVAVVGFLVFVLDPFLLFQSLLSLTNRDPWFHLLTVALTIYLGVPWYAYHAFVFLRRAMKACTHGVSRISKQLAFQIIAVQWFLIILQTLLVAFPFLITSYEQFYYWSLHSGANLLVVGTFVEAVIVLGFFGFWAAQFGLSALFAQKGIREGAQ